MEKEFSGQINQSTNPKVILLKTGKYLTRLLKGPNNNTGKNKRKHQKFNDKQCGD